MWGVGCVLAGLLLRREPMFRGKDNIDQLGTFILYLEVFQGIPTQKYC